MLLDHRAGLSDPLPPPPFCLGAPLKKQLGCSLFAPLFPNTSEFLDGSSAATAGGVQIQGSRSR